MIDYLERVMGGDRDEPAAARLDPLEAMLASADGEPAVAVPLLAALLDVPTGSRYPELDNHWFQDLF